jgi:hypothetical protein
VTRGAQTIRHKGLKRLFEDDEPAGSKPRTCRELQDILATLHAAPDVTHVDFTWFSIAPAKGLDEKLLGHYSSR